MFTTVHLDYLFDYCFKKLVGYLSEQWGYLQPLAIHSHHLILTNSIQLRELTCHFIDYVLEHFHCQYLVYLAAIGSLQLNFVSDDCRLDFTPEDWIHFLGDY